MRLHIFLLLFLLIAIAPLVYAQTYLNIDNMSTSSQNNTVDVIITFADSKASPRLLHLNAHDTKKDIIKNLKDKKSLRRQFSTINSISAKISKAELSQMKDNPHILSIEPNRQLQIFLHDSIEIINADAVWNYTISDTNLTGKDTTVCIIDTGTNYIHPDLGGCIGQGCKIMAGYDFVNNDNDPYDDHGHGTHVAGIVAANGLIKGVAPDAGIISMKALDSDGYGTLDNVISAMEWCIANASKYNISVISMSLGDTSYHYNYFCNDEDSSTTAMVNLAVANNISVVIASGNEGSYYGVSFPACIEDAIPVGATTKTDVFASYTNRGTEFPDMLLAPGSSIYSTYISGYKYMAGTSMATPHVSAAIALMRQAYILNSTAPLTPQKSAQKLKDTGIPILDISTSTYFSRIDIASALGINTTISPEAPSIISAYNNITQDNSANITIGETDSVFFNISADQQVNYTWYINSTDTGTDTSTYTLNTNLTDSGMILLKATVSNQNGSDSFQWNITIIDMPLAIIQYFPQDIQIQAEENTTSFFNITTSRNTTHDQWYINATEINNSAQTFNITWTFDNASDYTITYNGTDNIDNISNTWYITVLNKNRPPEISLSNITMNIENQTQINISANISDLDGDNLIITTDDSNITVEGHTLHFKYTQTFDQKPVTITVNDSETSVNQTIYITVTDTTPPQITIKSPENKTYNTTYLILELALSEEADTCTYILSSNNATQFNCSENITIISDEGSNNLTVTANDTAGNTANITVYFSTDTTSPQISMTSENYTSNNYFFINASISETPCTCILLWNNDTISMNTTNTSCFLNMTQLAPQTYVYSIYANDTVGNKNQTASTNLTVHYCIEGWSQWSSCISRSMYRTYTYRTCDTKIEYQSCGRSSRSHTSVIIPTLENQTDNSTDAANTTDNNTDMDNITYNITNSTGINPADWSATLNADITEYAMPSNNTLQETQDSTDLKIETIQSPVPQATMISQVRDITGKIIEKQAVSSFALFLILLAVLMIYVRHFFGKKQI